MRRLVALFATLTILLGCEEETACDRWADYVCACHDGDPAFDCEALRALAEEPSQDVVDQCAIDLADQEDVDEGAGETCEV
jgi:hypothetical protein